MKIKYTLNFHFRFDSTLGPSAIGRVSADAQLFDHVDLNQSIYVIVDLIDGVVH